MSIGNNRAAACDRVVSREINDALTLPVEGSSALVPFPTGGTRGRRVTSPDVYEEVLTALGMYFDNPPATPEARQREVKIIMATVGHNNLLPRRAANSMRSSLENHAKDPMHWEIERQFRTPAVPEVDESEAFNQDPRNLDGDFDEQTGFTGHSGLMEHGTAPYFLRLVERRDEPDQSDTGYDPPGDEDVYRGVDEDAEQNPRADEPDESLTTDWFYSASADREAEEEDDDDDEPVQ